MTKLLESPVRSAARSVDRAASGLAAGGMALLLDEETDSADVVSAGACTSAETVTFMACHARGLLCVALSAEQVDRLALRPMAPLWEQPRKPFTVSVDAREGITTGISAQERAHTIRVASAPDSKPADLVAPGHIFPLRATRGQRPRLGRTETAVELVQLAEQGPAAALCELLDDEGDLASAAFARAFARRFGLPVVSRQSVNLYVGEGRR